MTEKTNKQKNEILGDTSELYAAIRLGLKLNRDRWDKKSDATLKHPSDTEVKCQYYFCHLKHGPMLTIEVGQIPKCTNVEYLFYVISHPNGRNILYLIPKENRQNYVPYTTHYGKEMVGWKLKDAIMIEGTVKGKDQFDKINKMFHKEFEENSVSKVYTRDKQDFNHPIQTAALQIASTLPSIGPLEL